MLTSTQERYIDIYFASRSTGKTAEDLAADFGVDTRTVERGLEWCRKNRIGQRDTAADLERRIADTQRDIKGLEGDIRRVRREIRKRSPTTASAGPYLGLNNSLIGFQRELREQKKYLAELQGVYRTVVAHTVDDELLKRLNSLDEHADRATD